MMNIGLDKIDADGISVPQLNKESLKSKDDDNNELEPNAEQVDQSNPEKQSKLKSSDNNKNDIVSDCRQNAELELFNLMNPLGASEKLKQLKSKYITTVNVLTMTIFGTNQSNTLPWDEALVTTVKSQLQLRYQFLQRDWPMIDESSNKLLDSICKKHPNPLSFRSLSYDKLVSKYFSELQDDQDFLKQIMEKVWMEGNELRMKMNEYDLPPSLFDKLKEQGINRSDQLTDEALDELVQMDIDKIDEKLKDAKIEKKEKDNIRNTHAQFKKRISEMTKKESRQSKEKRKEYEEHKILTEAAIQNAENVKKSLEGDLTDNKDQVRTLVDELRRTLKVDWQFTETELNTPKEAVRQVLNDLNQMNVQLNLGDVCKSDEDLVNKISGGIALNGIHFANPTELGITAKRQLLACPTYCLLKSSAMAGYTQRKSFTSFEASNRFVKTIKTTGFTAATHIGFSFPGLHADGSFTVSSNKNSESSTQKKTQSSVAIEMECAIVPIKCFEIPREEMILSTGAKNELINVDDLVKARHFLKEFQSHVCEGKQHIGGIFIRKVEVAAEEETDVQELLKLAASKMDAKMSVGVESQGFSGGAGCTVGVSNAYGKTKGTQNIKKISTSDIKIDYLGPPMNNSDLFKIMLHSNNSSWHVIDRGDLTSFIPIWEIILTQEKYSAQQKMKKAAHLLKEASLQEAQHYDYHPLIKEEIERVQCGKYISNRAMKPNLTRAFTTLNDKNNLEMYEAKIVVGEVRLRFE
ncbi:unnamed protein product [Didymodactylos carnosus]|uniref:Uncharacterized protein n=1 Tax=Didymodactylos carnosus TaxID=1234261 RepID=A0A814WRH7_9BILA|nr:unnamed protein product [Didymodactylos carnosus]CAF1205967.1 unnamed protein product [Didymodactylos carnosus]CAF3777799.1 unnamed protein product [Didymodactylos carnosus]CAF3970250.1 unnamed protein product [Didymodactylos carnosus]